MNTVRNVHSPAGMGFSLHGTRYVHLKDCPKCKYGTIDLRRDKDGQVLFWECADCHARFTEEQLAKAKT